MSTPTKQAWGALWAMLLGYFMTLIDWTAVSADGCATIRQWRLGS